MTDELRKAARELAAPVAMTAIKTWQQRCEEDPAHEGIVTSAMVQAKMLEEIEALRAALAEPNCPKMLDSSEPSSGQGMLDTSEPIRALALVHEQAEDEGLWFEAQTATEAYLQAALRELHAAVESAGSGK